MKCITKISVKNTAKLKKCIAVAGIILFVSTGLTCLIMPQFNADIFLYVCAAICTLSTVFVWYEAFLKKRGTVYFEALVLSAVTVFLWLHRQSGEIVIVTVFALYLLVNSIAFAIQSVLDIKDRSDTWWYDLLRFVVYSLLFFATFSHGMDSLKYIQYIVGLYLIVQAAQLYFEMTSFTHPQSSRYYTFRYWSSLPVAFVAILPFFVLEMASHTNGKMDPVLVEGKDEKNEANLRVFVHTGLSGVHMFGHMTLAYKGMIYSYGNYDTANEKLFRSIGPGILFVCPIEQYIVNTCTYEHVTMFEYGLKLNEEQIRLLENTLEEIMAGTIEWEAPYEKALKKDPAIPFSQYETDYASRLWYRTRCRFYKFRSGQWKTYWILGTNCSLFAADILNQVDPAIHGSKGIVTPGEFYEYFEEAYADPKSNVVFKSWHSLSEPDTLPAAGSHQ